MAYEVIRLSMVVDAGAGQQARKCTRWRNKVMFKVALTAKKSLGTMNYAEVQG